MLFQNVARNLSVDSTVVWRVIRQTERHKEAKAECRE